MSPKVLIVFVVCVLAALVTIEVVFWILNVPRDIQNWILGTSAIGLAVYVVLSLLLRRITRPR